jgi:hypothetical protein
MGTTGLVTFTANDNGTTVLTRQKVPMDDVLKLATKINDVIKDSGATEEEAKAADAIARELRWLDRNNTRGLGLTV